MGGRVCIGGDTCVDEVICQFCFACGMLSRCCAVCPAWTIIVVTVAVSTQCQYLSYFGKGWAFQRQHNNTWQPENLYCSIIVQSEP